MKDYRRGLTTIALLFVLIITCKAQRLLGLVQDAQSKEPLTGALVSVKGTDAKAVTDIDGLFEIKVPVNAPCTLIISYVGYQSQQIGGLSPSASSDGQRITVSMRPDEHELTGVTVTGIASKNTESAAVLQVKNSQVIVSNVSAQEISKTQDSNAGEVIRRVPGVSLIEDKFVMVRGLSQRYNNVWINGSAVPSSEADSRAFSFDIIPSSQIDNLTIVKTPSAEYPADYTGGFIMVDTKEIPAENSFSVSLGGNWNTASAFKDFSYNKGSGTDFLGFDGGLRSLDGGINAALNPIAGEGTDLLHNGLNNDWSVRNHKPMGDLKLAASLNRRWQLGGRWLGMIAAVNYTNEYRTYENMQNNLFGVYDVINDRSNYLRHSVDDQFNHNVRVGAMLNFTFLSKDGNHKYQLKNIFNQLGNSRYTWREGVSAQANIENSAEYYYRSRTTYNGQLTGKHTLGSNIVDWSAGYAYANRHLPDRRRYLVDDAIESNVMALTTGNDISREWTQLDEHILSANINARHDFDFNGWRPFLKAGAYTEYRTREYTTREFIYNWNVSDNNMPADFRHAYIPDLLSNADNFGADKLYLLEQVRWRNNYSGHNTLGAGYLTASIPFGKLGINAGVRYEHNDMELVSNTRDNERSETSRHYRTNDLFPSVNAVCKFNDRHQLRMSYGKSVNRPEFREVSSSVFYDFDLASSVQGNTELRNCYVHNADLRYEFYPNQGELISLAVFYKHFDSPIEWTYTVAGGTDLIYSYKNAKSANNYGLEVDVRKDLTFIGLPGFSWSFNGSLIKSRVEFEKGSKEENRPMQGQSPYLINTGLFYKNDRHQLNVGLLYNRIGKRIIGVGRSEGTTGSDENARIPDSYEMPRNVFDLTAGKQFGKHWELKLTVRDLLAEKVYYKQFADVRRSGGSSRTVEEITRCYDAGRNIGFNCIYRF